MTPASVVTGSGESLSISEPLSLPAENILAEKTTIRAHFSARKRHCLTVWAAVIP